MSRYESYHLADGAPGGFRRWIWLGLVFSLLFHAGLLVFFYRHQLSGFSLEEQPPAPPLRPFTMKQVTIPEMPKEEQRLSMPAEQVPNPKALSLPSEKPEITEYRVAPQIDDLKQAFTDKPKVDMAGLEQSMKSAASSRTESDRELSTIAQSLIKEGPVAARQPIIPVGKGSPGAGEGSMNANIPGIASVDEMLNKAGTLRAGDRAAMSGGALFDYDQFQLRPESQEALRKIGNLILQNPRATFAIEGHTDSFGPPEYNQKLSQLRAESVKTWLVEVFGIAPERIQTIGFGNSKPLVPADQDKEAQAPNRRVEIVVKINRG